MNLNIETWDDYRIDEVLDIYNGKGITQEEVEENAGKLTVVQSGEENNGVLGYIDMAYCISMNYTFTDEMCLTVARSGSAGYVSFQANGCVVGDSAKILKLKDKNAENELVYLFLRTILMANKYKYTYGRKVTEAKYASEIIALPTKNGAPDWDFMKKYMKSLKYKKLSTKNKAIEKLSIVSWETFRFGDYISDIYKGKAINKDDLIIANSNDEYIRYITRTGDNNGCELLAKYESIDNQFIEEGNAITIGDTTATCFYQEESFITGDHMVVIRADWLNKYTGLFMVALLTNEQYKYSYGRAYLMDRIKDTMLKLPAKQEKGITLPNWGYMEKYMKSLPYGDRL